MGEFPPPSSSSRLSSVSRGSVDLGIWCSDRPSKYFRLGEIVAPLAFEPKKCKNAVLIFFLHNFVVQAWAPKKIINSVPIWTRCEVKIINFDPISKSCESFSTNKLLQQQHYKFKMSRCFRSRPQTSKFCDNNELTSLPRFEPCHPREADPTNQQQIHQQQIHHLQQQQQLPRQPHKRNS